MWTSSSILTLPLLFTCGYIRAGAHIRVTTLSTSSLTLSRSVFQHRHASKNKNRLTRFNEDLEVTAPESKIYVSALGHKYTYIRPRRQTHDYSAIHP